MCNISICINPINQLSKCIYVVMHDVYDFWLEMAIVAQVFISPFENSH